MRQSLSPNVAGEHDSLGSLGRAEVELIHRVVSDPGRLSEPWTETVLSMGLSEGEYVEIVGIVALAIRRGILRPAGLGTTVSKESILIAGFIATLMVTYLLTFRIADDSLAGRVNWWVHMVIILTFLGLIPNSKHLHLLLSPLTVFFKSPELGTVPPLDFEKEQVGQIGRVHV